MSSSVNRPPFGSWPRCYAIVCAVALGYIALLYWFVRAFNHPGGPA
ncbi:MAG: hypothetical protein KDC87_10870 [Planctomycetes bacterium]|nr:hypothetical protein [Planctomycetota bacterium]MCB9869907.1 hypothetical protein [Planctomycetota bacterium]